MSKTIVLAGALDTKGADYLFVKELIEARGHTTVVVDFGVLGDPPFAPDVTHDEVAVAGGSSVTHLRAAKDKTEAMRVMADGLDVVVQQLYQAGRLDGILAMGGGGGTAIATAAMRGLPVGVPKLMVTTVASGDVAPYVGTADITMMPSVVDVSGLNRLSRRIYANAAGAICGMVEVEAPAAAADRRLLAASMFGNTTAAVTRAQATLEQAGYEVLVFHATGTGGRTMESLVAGGFIAGVLDITTTELADHVCGGVLSAGPERMLAAARCGVPAVLAPGCVDMVNFWGRATVPEKYQDRNLYEWNSNITLMRTTVDENRQMGEMIAAAANASTGLVAVLLPLKGVSQLDSLGGQFWDPAADGACYDAIKVNLKPGIPVHEIDCNINDPQFADKATELLLAMLS